ncbi:MAG: cysteine hydrolase [Actinomycetales bacterium]|nr:cysteine hydrolase [Actinomycetales bacterium]
MAPLLLVIDIQNDYFDGGAHPLVGSAAAGEAAGRAIARFRAAGAEVIHVRHSWDEPDAPYLRTGTPGAEIHASVRPAEGETVIVKEHPNAFLETDLGAQLAARGTRELVVAGMMTSMCVDATVRAALDLGFEVTLLADACAAPDLEFAGTRVDGASVHAAFVAALGDSGATVALSDDVSPGS